MLIAVRSAAFKRGVEPAWKTGEDLERLRAILLAADQRESIPRHCQDYRIKWNGGVLRSAN
jgi:hypothetical protein